MVQNWDEKKQKEFREFEQRTHYTEDRVIEVLEKKANKENWISKTHIGSDTGIDLKLQKDNRIVIIEAKGERLSQKNTKQRVEAALGAIVMNIKQNDPEMVYYYCVAFPDTGNFRKVVNKITSKALQALRLNIIFVNCPKELIEFRGFNSSDDIVLNSLDELFKD